MSNFTFMNLTAIIKDNEVNRRKLKLIAETIGGIKGIDTSDLKLKKDEFINFINSEYYQILKNNKDFCNAPLEQFPKTTSGFSTKPYVKDIVTDGGEHFELYIPAISEEIRDYSKHTSLDHNNSQGFIEFALKESILLLFGNDWKTVTTSEVM